MHVLAYSVVGLYVRVLLVTPVSRAKTAEPIENKR